MSATRWLRRFHDAVRGFRPAGVVRWRLGTQRLPAGSIVCHHDVGWYNLAFVGEQLTGVFDWDVAGPGHPLDDLAFAAWNNVPLFGADLSPERVASRLAAMAQAYGGVAPAAILQRAVPRVRASRRKISTGAAHGDPGMLALVETGVLHHIDQRLADFHQAFAAVADALARHPD
ncbi:MAG: phosphotransferase [Actinomycetota bacterium]|nr:phosphotransferase [Actinomycetota bacterium]